jgi:hypothetical protein
METKSNVITKEMLGWPLDGIVVKVAQGIRENGNFAEVEKDGKKVREYECPQIEMAIDYDFDGVTLQTVLDKAIETYTVRFAQRARAHGTAWMQANFKKVVKIAEFFVGRTAAPKKSEKEMIGEFFNDLDAEQKKELIKNPDAFLNEFYK